MIRPLFFLDEPQHQHLTGEGPWRFRGAVLAIDGREVESIRIGQHETPVDRECPELAFLPFPRAGRSRFEVVLDRPESEIRAIYTDESEELLFRLAGNPRHDIQQCVRALPQPSPELVATTQGGQDVRAYIESIISGLHTVDSLLRASGVNADDMRSVLDIGCGTGRLLMGWHCADPRRQITGVDINADLIAWSKTNLPGSWSVCDVLPPLRFDDAQFDFVQLISVFTHLPLEHQRKWIEEIRRVLKPGGVLLITLHGTVYARIFGQAGEYAELPSGPIGSNAFATFHQRAFAERLFEGFDLLGYFERGHDAAPPTLFPIAALQDVYVFRKA